MLYLVNRQSKLWSNDHTKSTTEATHGDEAAWNLYQIGSPLTVSQNFTGPSICSSCQTDMVHFVSCIMESYLYPKLDIAAAKHRMWIGIARIPKLSWKFKVTFSRSWILAESHKLATFDTKLKMKPIFSRLVI